MTLSPSTCAKSRTRLRSLFATRGVPRLRRAISSAASASMLTPRMFAERRMILPSSAGVYISRRMSMPNLSRRGLESIPARVVAPMSVNFFSGMRMLLAMGPLPETMSSE